MGDNPLISVIVIFFNEEQFIEAAIKSIFAQTYSNWELLLVDDGSTDESTTIARRYGDLYPTKVCYLEHAGHKNRGMSASRNLGIANAKGDLIAFLDADDIWLPQKLERQTAALVSRPEVEMVYGPTQWWYSWTNDPKDCLLDFIHDIGVPPNVVIQPPELLIRYLRTEGISPCTCSVLIRRKAIERVGRFEEIFRGLYEDQAFFAKICLSSPVFVMSECFARYRQDKYSNPLSQQEVNQQAEARQVFLNWLSTYLKTKEIDDRAVWKALKTEMLPYRYPRIFHLFRVIRQSLPGKVYRRALHLLSRWYSLPLIRELRCLQFRRLQPLDNGWLRGTEIVRYYWDRFLQQNRHDIRCKALEIGTTYTIRQYGGQALDQADAIDLHAHSPEVTIVSDLSRADSVPADLYDCFVVQFTTHLIYDIEAALYHAVRILKPGGVLLINFPCLDYYFPRGLDMGTGEPLFMYWWFTPMQVENLFRRIGLYGTDYSLTIYGNLFTRIAYQINMPAEDLTRRELEVSDSGFPLLICARVVKPSGWSGRKPDYRDPWRPDIKPAQWNPETGHYHNEVMEHG